MTKTQTNSEWVKLFLKNNVQYKHMHMITAWSSKKGWIARFLPKYECAFTDINKAWMNEHHKTTSGYYFTNSPLQTHH